MLNSIFYHSHEEITKKINPNKLCESQSYKHANNL